MESRYNWLIDHKDIQQEECLIWPFAKHHNSYGQVGIPGTYTSELTHRVMCELKYGPPPEGKPLALHKCNNPPCINPEHLFWGNNSDNQKGNKLKLTKFQIKYILNSKESSRCLAEFFNISKTTILRIRKGQLE